MIDDEADFGNIIDGPAEVQIAAKFRPKVQAKPRKPSVTSRSLAPNPTVETTDEKVEALSKDNASQELTINQETPSLRRLGSKIVGDATNFRGILDTPSEDGLTVSLGPVSNPDVTLDSPTGGVTAIDRVIQNEKHNDDPSEVATHQENLVVSDTQASSTCSSGKTIGDLADFGGFSDTQVEEERVAKFQPGIQVKLSKAASKSQKTNQKVGASTIDVVSQNKEDGNNQTRCNNEQLQAPRHQEIVKTSDSQASLGTDNSTVDLANLSSILEEHVQEERAVKFQPKLRLKPGRASPRVAGTNDKAAAATPEVGFFDVDVVSRDTEDDSHGEGHNDDLCQKRADQEGITVGDIWPPQDVDAIVDLDSHDEHGARSIFGEPSADANNKFQPNVGRKNRKGKSVSFVLPDASEGVAPNDIATDENINNSPQQTAEKHCITEERHSNDQEYTDRESQYHEGEQHSNDQEYTDSESQYHEGEPSEHAVDQQPTLDAGKAGLSMKLRSRKKLQKVGIPEHTAVVNFDEDYVEPLAVEQGIDSGDEYTVGGKQKVWRKSRGKGIHKEPWRSSKHTSKDSAVDESQQQKLQKNKSEVSSRGRKRTLKDTSIEQPEKKLTHRIRQKRMKEVKTLLETPDHEIDRMKLSVTHLRLLQEARERVKVNKIPSGPSSSNQSSSQLGDTDDFDFFGDKELDNYDNDRTESHIIENATKLNYHSYMNKQTRAKWSKSDTDLFYQGLRQFGSDFAMIQQLFPDKTRNQVRQKFKTEEKKHPMQVHDAIIHCSRDNLYFKKVIKQLNIEGVLPEINNRHKQEGASNEGNPGNENTLDDFINEEEENGSNWSDKEPSTHRSEVQEGEHVSANADDDLDDVFDWY